MHGTTLNKINAVEYVQGKAGAGYLAYDRMHFPRWTVAHFADLCEEEDGLLEWERRRRLEEVHSCRAIQGEGLRKTRIVGSAGCTVSSDKV